MIEYTFRVEELLASDQFRNTTDAIEKASKQNGIHRFAETSNLPSDKIPGSSDQFPDAAIDLGEVRHFEQSEGESS